MSKHLAEQLTLDFSGARPLSQVLEQKRTIRARRDASLHRAASDDAEKAAKDAEAAAKTAAIRRSLRALVGEDAFREIMERYASGRFPLAMELPRTKATVSTVKTTIPGLL